MKKIVLSFFLIVGFAVISFSQDIIVKTDGSTIKCEILEVDISTIKYKRNDNPGGPAYFIEKTEIAEIIYENGSRDVFNMEIPGNINNKSMDVSENRKGYIAITLGPAFPMGDFANHDIMDPKAGLANTGFQFNLVNFGYRFSKNIGIAGLWNGTAHTVEFIDEATWSHGYFLGGLLITFPSKKVDFDIRLLGGYMNATLKIPTINAEAKGTAFGFDIGGVVRAHLSQKTSFVLSLDYAGGKPTLSSNIGMDFTQSIENITLAVGIAFRLK